MTTPSPNPGPAFRQTPDPAPDPASGPNQGGPDPAPRPGGDGTSLFGHVRGILGSGGGLALVGISAVVLFAGGAVVGRGMSSSSSAAPGPTVTVVRTVPASPVAGGGDAASPSTVPSASAAAPTASPAASGGVAGAPGGGTSLSALQPLQNRNAGGFTIGPVLFGTTSFQQSVRFSCWSINNTSLVYNVAGFSSMDVTIGVPNDATNGAGNTAQITFMKNGSTTELGKPVTVDVGQPQKIHLDLQGSDQLQINCNATDNTNHQGTNMDVALGNAVLNP